MNGVRFILSALEGPSLDIKAHHAALTGATAGVPAWLSKQARCEPASIPGDFPGTLLVLATSCSTSDPVRQVRDLRRAAPYARVRVVAEPSAVRALAVLAAHGEDDWLPHGSELSGALGTPALSACVVDCAWGGMPPLEMASVHDILARHGFALNASELALEVVAHERTLRRQAMAACGRTPKEVIMGGRHAITRHMLTCGVGPSHIAPALGYASTGSLGAAFGRREGMSPRSFMMQQERKARTPPGTAQ